MQGSYVSKFLVDGEIYSSMGNTPALKTSCGSRQLFNGIGRPYMKCLFTYIKVVGPPYPVDVTTVSQM